MPGRGAGAPGTGGRVSFATRSGRGGTTGRSAGWPARFGLAGGRSGLPPPSDCADPGTFTDAGGPGALGTGGRGAGVLGVGMLGIGAAEAGAGRRGLDPGPCAAGAIGEEPKGDEDGAVLAGEGKDGGCEIPGPGAWNPGGIGCLGPVRICPGLGGGGAGLDGIGMPRGPGVASGGAIGWPPASGGRKGAMGRAIEGASTASLTSFRVSTGASEITGGGTGDACRSTGAGCSAGVVSGASGSAGRGARRAASTAASPPKRRLTNSA